MTSNLKDINFGFNQYCGPAVLSALTGESTDRCAAVISAVSGKKEIKAVLTVHLLEAFKRLNFVTTRENDIGRTLFITLNKLVEKDGFYIVLVPHHVVAIEVRNKEIFLIDNHTKSPLQASSSARLQQKVDEVYKITPKEKPKFISSKIEIFSRMHILYIIRITEFEDKTDNTSLNLGSFRYIDHEELKQIFEEFKRFVRK